MVVPNPALILPQLLDLHRDAERLSIQLGRIEDSLHTLERQTEPISPVYVNSTSVKLEAFRVVKSGAGRLYGFSGYNSNASDQFVLGFDKTAVPSNGDVPDFVMRATASSNFWVSWTPAWREFQEGWVLCNSSTAATLTAGSADCWFDAQYE